MSYSNVVDVISDVVALMRDGSEIPYYYYGHPGEIVNTLAEKDKNKLWKLKKYPAVFLIHSFEEIRSDGELQVNGLRLVFVTETKHFWKASERYQNVFDPVLTPLVDRFIHELKNADGIEFDGRHKRKIYPFWGSEQGKNVGNDFADAIEVTIDMLTIFPECDLHTINTPYVISAFTSMDGKYIYLKLSQRMGPPNGLHESISVSIATYEGGEHEYGAVPTSLTEITPYSIWHNEEDHSLFIVDLTPAQIINGDVVTISLPANTFPAEDDNDIYLLPYTQLNVVNNVL